MKNPSLMVKWIIQSACKEADKLKSNVFKSEFSEAEWFLILTKKRTNICQLTLDFASGAFAYSAQVSIINQDENKIIHGQLSGACKNLDLEISWDDLFSDSFGFVQDDILSIEVEINWNLIILAESLTLFTLAEPKSLADVMLLNFKKERFTDCVLVVANEEIKAHKNVLAGYSEVFQAVFTDNTTSRIQIEETSPQVVRTALEHVYSDGATQITENLILGVLTFADKYAFVSLLNKCQTLIVNSLNISNFCDVYTVFEKLQTQFGLFACVQFFHKNGKQIVNSESFRQVDPIIAKQLLENYFRD
uniref:BTB domain-containing protein n=1 Tax=Panagrolaimus sp. JU765 TaxID=591449 RepID=A0AC34RKB4_9BILA